MGGIESADRRATATDSAAAAAAAAAAAVAPPAANTGSRTAAAVAFVGKQNSGKTTLFEQLISELSRRGLHVATLKHHSHTGFDFDIPGKDSWRHRQAGSVHTVVAAPDQIASVQALTEELDASAIVDMMRDNARRSGVKQDIILVEGYRHGNLPTIELFRSGNPKDEERNLGVEGNEIVAVVTNIERIANQAAMQNLPVYDFSDIQGITNFLTTTFVS